MSNTATVAKEIRSVLRAAYPEIRFSVRSPYFDKIVVTYRAEIASDYVNALLSRFKAGHFDGMTDSYEYNPNPDNVPRVRFLFVQRENATA